MGFVKASIAGAIVALAGCSGLETDKLVEALPGGVTPAAPSLAMFGGSVQAVGPTGFCVDPDSSRPQKGFAIFAPCSTLEVEGAAAVATALATVQFGPEQSAIVGQDVTGFANYLKGVDGPVVLSRSGDAGTVKIIEIRDFEKHVAVYLSDKTPAYIEGAQESEWRAFLDIAGRLATISVRGLDAAPLSDAAGAALLEQAVTALIAANAAPAR
jgi:hypothetical protein